MILLTSAVLLIMSASAAEQETKNLGQDPEYTKLYIKFEKLQNQLVEAEKEAGQIYRKYLEDRKRGRRRDLSEDPFYKRAREKRDRIFMELTGVMEQMSMKARQASGSTETLPQASEMPKPALSPQPQIFIKEPEATITYPTMKSLENKTKKK
jgi:hypothetical protein